MTAKDLIKLSLKLIALFYAFSALVAIITNVSYFIAYDSMLSLSSLWMTLNVLIPVIVYYLVFRKSDWIVEQLRLDKGFENKELHFGNLTSKEVLKIAFLIAGIMLLIDGLPSFLTHCFYAFKYSAETKIVIDNSYTKKEYFDWTLSGVYVLFGYLMISNFKRIANWFDK